VAQELLRLGWQVVGVSRGTRHQVSSDAAPAGLATISGSVADPAVVDHAFRVADSHGALRLVVNCAGSARFAPVGQNTPRDVIDTVESNLIGLMLFTDRAVDELEGREATVVNVMSTAAKKIPDRQSAYSASKWGAKTYTRAVQLELEARHSSIRVIQAYPCGMRTEFWDGMDPARPADYDGYPDPQTIAGDIVGTVVRRATPYTTELVFHR
jgi:NAD(P)-dependent dehydrogenase (short-subunit alcohol dehydrogenase family)